MALYTICYVLKKNKDCIVKLGEKKIILNVFTIYVGSKDGLKIAIGSAYPKGQIVK